MYPHCFNIVYNLDDDDMRIMMRIMGIDPSMHSSGQVIMDLDDTMNVKNIHFYGYHTAKIRCISTDNIEVTHLPKGWDKKCVIERRMIAINILLKNADDIQFMSIEDYAYGELKSKKCKTNSILQLAEFSGTLKTEMYKRGIGVIAYPIGSNKMFATGNGAAGKPGMCNAMKEMYPNLFPKEFDGNYDSPVNDMVDAFWLCEVLRNHIKYDKGLPMDDITKGLLEYSSGSGKCLVNTRMDILR